MVIKLMPYKVASCGISDIGLVRQNNEDSWAQLDLNFFALADGMGGHRAGEVAAREAIQALCDHFEQALAGSGRNLPLEQASDLVQQSIEHANEKVYELSKANSDLRGMGTTLCCIYCHPKGVIYAHVGDSRIYRFRQGLLEQITKDHSLLRELVDLGQIDEQNVGDFLYKNIITKAIGTESYVEPSVQMIEISDNDIFLMCTDGLSDMLSIKEIEAILNNNPDIDTASKKLVVKAKEKGGFDNVTIVMVKVNLESVANASEESL